MLGQFTQRDPLGYAAGDENLYRYVANSPISQVDPSGFIVYSHCPLDDFLVNAKLTSPTDYFKPTEKDAQGYFVYEMDKTAHSADSLWKASNGSNFKKPTLNEAAVIKDILLTMMYNAEAESRKFYIAGNTEADALRNLKLQVYARWHAVENAVQSNFTFGGGQPWPNNGPFTHNVGTRAIVKDGEYVVTAGQDPNTALHTALSNSAYNLYCQDGTNFPIIAGVGDALKQVGASQAELNQYNDAASFPMRENAWTQFLTSDTDRSKDHQDYLWVPGDAGAVVNLAPPKDPVQQAVNLGENILYIVPDIPRYVFWTVFKIYRTGR